MWIKTIHTCPMPKINLEGDGEPSTGSVWKCDYPGCGKCWLLTVEYRNFTYFAQWTEFNGIFVTEEMQVKIKHFDNQIEMSEGLSPNCGPS